MGLLEAGIGALGNIATAGINYAAVQSTNRAQKELYKQQQADAVKMWQMQNEYNSPSAQMQRYSDAGLNPNLAYGSGTPGNATSAPQVATPPTLSTYQAPQGIVSDAVRDYYSTDISSIDVQLRSSDLILKGLDAISKRIQNERDETQKRILQQSEQELIKINKYQSQNLLEQGVYLRQQNEVQKFNFELDKKFQPLLQQATIDNLNVRTQTELTNQFCAIEENGRRNKLNDAQIAKLKADTAQAYQTIVNLRTENQYCYAKIANTNADTNLKNSQSRYVNTQQAGLKNQNYWNNQLYRDQHNNNLQDLTFKQYQNRIKENEAQERDIENGLYNSYHSVGLDVIFYPFIRPFKDGLPIGLLK